MNTGAWGLDKLAQRTEELLHSYRGMGKAHEPRERICANDPRKKLPADFVRAVQSVRVRIDTLIGEITVLGAALAAIQGTDQAKDPATIADFNSQFHSLVEKGRIVMADFEKIADRVGQLVPNGIWVP